MSPKLILALLILTGVIFIVFGILFIWYRRKTTLATSTVGHLHKLIPSLKEKEQSLNSLLPIFSEFVHPTNVKSTNLETTNAVSRKSSPTRNEQSLPTMVPHRHTKSNKPKMAFPSTNINKQTEIEPISLDLFNCAATDLDAKGQIQLNRYQKYLLNRIKRIMDAAYEFALNGELMDFALDRIWEGHTLPSGLFIVIITEKCQLINKHLCRVIDHLVLMASVTNMAASIKFYDINIEYDNQLVQVTQSNLPDLEDQLRHLWTEVCSLLKSYQVDDHAAQLASIDQFYHNLAYDQLMQANFLDF